MASAKKKKELLLAKENIIEIKRNVLDIVESLLEKNISCEWFLDNCGKLCQDDYQDVIHERSIDRICGYPLCDKKIEAVPKQKYKISLSLKKVYDLTDRKCFCSNDCCSASKFILLQLPELPLHMRKYEKKGKITLLEKDQIKGKAGDEIMFDLPVAKDDDTKEEETKNVTSNYVADLLKNEVQGCTELLKDIKITERVVEKPYVFEPKPSKNSKSSESSSNPESDEEEDIFPNYENASALLEKYMPQPVSEVKGAKKAMMIDPLKIEKNHLSCDRAVLSIDFFRSVFKDWFTVASSNYLLDKAKISITESNQQPIQFSKELQSVIDSYENSPQEKRIPIRRPRAKQKKEKSTVEARVDRLAPQVSSDDDRTPEPSLPLVPSLSQNAFRKQLVLEKLKAAYFNVFPPVGLYYQDIAESVHKLVETFSLSPTNVTFKLIEWKCIAILLFGILTTTKLKGSFNEDKLTTLNELVAAQTTLTSTELESLPLDVISLTETKNERVEKNSKR